VTFTASHAVPLGQVGHLTCQTTGTGNKPIWILNYKNGETQLILPFYHSCNEMCAVSPPRRGITYSYNSSFTSSTLMVEGSEMNNGTTVECLRYGSEGNTGNKEATFQVYGKPIANRSQDFGGDITCNTYVPKIGSSLKEKTL